MIVAALYDPAELPALEEAVLRDLADVDAFPVALRFKAERIAGWDFLDLSDVIRRSRGVEPDPTRYPTHVSLVREVAELVDAHLAPDRIEFQTAQIVADRVCSRWRRAGLLRWGRDARGLPVPLLPAARCEHVYCFRESPSGKALFACASCDGTPTPNPGLGNLGACPGKTVGVAHRLAEAFVAGVRYELGAFGPLVPAGNVRVPLPAKDADELEACRRCWAVAPKSALLPDRIAHVSVCAECRSLPPGPWTRV